MPQPIYPGVYTPQTSTSSSAQTDWNWRDINPFMASNNPDTQAYMGLHAAADKARAGANTPDAWAQQHGQDMLKMLAGGLGLGAGGLALYHLSRGLRSSGKKERKYQNMATGTPMIADDKTASFDINALTDSVTKGVGSIPQFLAHGLPGAAGDAIGNAGSGAPSDPEAIRGGIASALKLGLGATGLIGGGAAINAIMKQKQKADARDEVEDARRYYHAVLTGADKRASALDRAFERHCGKQASTDPLSGLFSIATDTVPRHLTTASVLASLAAAGIGGAYMYDRTLERTQGENLAKAQASRARMSGLPKVWIDPEQLAQVKQLAAQRK
jgi:hypothetical protein